MKTPWHWHRLTRLPFLSEGDTGWRAGQVCETARTGVWVWMWEPRAGVWSEKGPKPEPLETATLKRWEEEPERTICQEEREPGPEGRGRVGRVWSARWDPVARRGSGGQTTLGPGQLRSNSPVP